MKNSILLSICKISLLSAYCIAIMSSCKKEDITGKPVLDKESFFTIKFDNKVYTAYGYYDDASPTPYGGPYGGPSVLQSTALNSSGILVGSVVLYARDFYYSNTQSNPLSLGNCDLQLSIQKDDLDLLGVYSAFSNYNSQGININTTEEIYFTPTGCRLSLDRIVEHPTSKAEMVEGTISCRVYTGASGLGTFPAVGNFRMYLTH